MDVNRINDMVDRKVIQSFQEGFSIGAIQSDLMVRMKNFMKTIEKDDKVKLDYGLFNLPQELVNQNLENSIENPKKLSRDEKDLKLLES